MKSWGSTTTSVGYSLLFSSCVHNAASSTPLSGEKMTMILQQSATFERKSDGAIAIQCSVCFFSGFSTCHCSSSSNAHAVAGSTQAAQQTPSSKSKKVSAANAASASPSAPLPSKKGGGLPTSPSTKNNINEESSQTTNTLTDAEAKLRLGTW